MSECEAILGDIDQGMPLSYMLKSPYIQVSYALKRATQHKQQIMWHDGARILPTACAWHAAAKKRWGIDTILEDYSPETAKTFIHFRAGQIKPPLRTLTGSGLSACAFCHWTSPQPTHILWQCTRTSGPRAHLMANLPRPVLDSLQGASPEEAGKMMMGGGATLSENEWLFIAPAAVEFIVSVAGIIRDTEGSNQPEMDEPREWPRDG